MKRFVGYCTIALFLLAFNVYAEEKETKVTLRDLPPAAQKSVQNLIKGAELKGLSKEDENGKTVYEVETVKNGKTRDALIDAGGTVLEIEEGTTLNEIPGPVKAAIEKAAGGGKIAKIEVVTKGNSKTYEAVIAKAGKSMEIKVTAEGSVLK